jgi:MoaA/NifB/PqqE/SkfB family radical SAM enzyme
MHGAGAVKNIYKNIVPPFLRHILWYSRIYFTHGIIGKKRDKLKFEIHVADHCNLNCIGCNHFSPLAEEKFLDLNTYESDCKRIADLTKRQVENIRLLGGEPLLHQRIIDIIAITRKYFNEGTVIEIVTNGVLLLKMDSVFWEYCKKNNIVIYVTHYPIKLDIDKIKEKCREYNIRLDYIDNREKYMYKEPLNLNGTGKIKREFAFCFKANNCIQLNEGKLYPCPILPHVKYFNKYFNKHLEISDKDYIDIYKAKNINEITRFLSKPIPFCRYCNSLGKVINIPWRVSKKEIGEWV